MTLWLTLLTNPSFANSIYLILFDGDKWSIRFFSLDLTIENRLFSL